MVRAPNVLFLSAVEPSGDRLGACLVRALRDAGFDGKIVGLGGPLMAREGLETVAGIPPRRAASGTCSRRFPPTSTRAAR